MSTVRRPQVLHIRCNLRDDCEADAPARDPRGAKSNLAGTAAASGGTEEQAFDRVARGVRGLAGGGIRGESLMSQSQKRQVDSAAVRALAVVVLYRTSFDESKTIAGLAQAFQEDPMLKQQLDVLVWDNGPEAQEESRLPFLG